MFVDVICTCISRGFGKGIISTNPEDRNQESPNSWQHANLYFDMLRVLKRKQDSSAEGAFSLLLFLIFSPHRKWADFITSIHNEVSAREVFGRRFNLSAFFFSFFFIFFFFFFFSLSPSPSLSILLLSLSLFLFLLTFLPSSFPPCFPYFVSISTTTKVSH